MSSTPPPAGSTGTTTAGSTDQSGWSHPPNTSKPATLRSYPRCSPYESGTKPGALQDHRRAGRGARTVCPGVSLAVWHWLVVGSAVWAAGDCAVARLGLRRLAACSGSGAGVDQTARL